MAPKQLTLDDSSPTISYYPFRDTFSTPDISAGWNPYYNVSGFNTLPGQLGNGTSYHVTSHPNAKLTIAWKGTGIDLYGYTQGGAQYTVFFDDDPYRCPKKPGLLASCISSGSSANTNHTVTLQVDALPGGHPEAQIFFDKAVVYTTIPSDYSLQVFDDGKADFSANWTSTGNGNITHVSTAQGDMVQVDFNGVGFLLTGDASPNAGSYSVALDGVNTVLSAKSSFDINGTTLFFATGLDAAEQHIVQLRNMDGSQLSLPNGWFKLYAPPPASPTGAAHSKGTIAALVLAGILGFLIISGSFFFMLIIRPRRHREKQARMRRRRMRKGQVSQAFPSAPSVVFPDELDLGSMQATPGHRIQRTSGLSGFARWKKEVEGNFESLGLGITFRHSVSTGRRAARRGEGNGEYPSSKSSIFSFSSIRGKGKTRAKAKNNQSASSHSYTLEFPQPKRPESSLASLKEKFGGSTHPFLDNHSITSELTSLSYMNTPSALAAPPSYTLSHDHSGSDSVSPFQSAMRLTPLSTPSLNNHSRKANALLGGHADLGPNLPAPRDRGSAHYSSDDATSYLGSATARAAMRSLSPRTSEHVDQPPPIPAQPDGLRGQQFHEAIPTNIVHQPGNEHLSPQPPTFVATPAGSDSSFLHMVSPPNRPFKGLVSSPRDDTMVRDPGSASKGVRTASRNVSHSQTSNARSTSENEPKKRNPGKMTIPRHMRSIFGLSKPSTSNSAPRSHGRSASFLDFNSSPETSQHTQSDLLEQTRQHSRLSSTPTHATQVTRSGSSGTSRLIPSPTNGLTPYFPYPVSLPPSPYHPEGHISSTPAQPNLPRIEPRRARRHRPTLSALGSPTKSVPTSVIELELGRISLSAESSNNHNSAQLPPHPPLPPNPTSN